METLTLNGKLVAKAPAKVLVRSEPENMRLGTEQVHNLPDGEYAVQGLDQKGFYVRDSFGHTTDEFHVRKSKAWYSTLVIKGDKFRLVG